MTLENLIRNEIFKILTYEEFKNGEWHNVRKLVVCNIGGEIFLPVIIPTDCSNMPVALENIKLVGIDLEKLNKSKDVKNLKLTHFSYF